MVDTTGRVTLWGIEVFLAIAEEQSISVAARRLGASNSAVSQQLSNLETALGAVLVDRRARPFRLTPAGELYRRRARAILDEAEQARAELARAELAQLTRLRLGMIEDFDADVTPRLLTDMADDLTGARFLLETGPSHRLNDQLDARALDVIVAAEMGAPADWMEVHPLLEEPFVAAVPRGAGDANDALRQLPFIQYSPRHHMGRKIAEHLARQEMHLGHRFELDSYHAIMAMVAVGAGWTILTPLGVLRAHRFVEAVDILPLPVAPLSRRVSLSARAGVLGDMPGQVAARLKPLLSELIVAPALARYPFLDGALRVL
ncbi:LysR family transcriptional regulator [Sinisalibacter aestuarii]|uniref:LysR family transcriptional regulator n=1 Tax=Sinisalibacter aestuarii TaxID=2949426 RepID=A0ABQ5LWV8_9RHOB|nr:LysR family transcriptional regulator [Sinisalibacter aestuarii]GKY89409.1 LysR family transcriptional regulator [Sinisalibacter aestuarii]